MDKPKSISVFIIDDSEMTRTVLRMIIQGDTYDVIGDASNGKSGLEGACRLRPDIICLDVVMPECDGLEVLRKSRRHCPRRRY